MDHKYFAYGSNLIFERITERLGKVKFLGTASIRNWCLRFNKLGADGSGKCNIIESQGEFVHGILYQISPRQKEKLDKFERGYKTMFLQIPHVGKCVSYKAIEITDDRVYTLPYDWYRELVLIGAKRYGFPPHYISMLEKQKIMEDSDNTRRTKNLEILKQ